VSADLIQFAAELFAAFLGAVGGCFAGQRIVDWVQRYRGPR
jgi:hypothetical protein